MAAINMPYRREEKDPLDTILKGLNIAANIYGIKEAGERSAALAETKKRDVESHGANLAKTNAETEKIKAEALYTASGKGKTADENGLSELIKRQQATLQGLQIQDRQKSAQEVSGTKAVAATYGQRMDTANKIMEKLSSEGFDRTSKGESAMSMLPSGMGSSQLQQQEQAERNFLNAVLRRESGAVISPDEFTSGAKQYFPRWGDAPEVLNQKAQNRAQAIAGLRTEAGDAWGRVQQNVAATPSLSSGQKSFLSGLSIPKANASEGVSVQDAAAQTLIKRKGLGGKVPR